MINTLLVIFFSLSCHAGNAMTGQVVLHPEVRVEVAAAQDEAVSQEEAQALYGLMEENRQRIFHHLGERTEQEIMADIEVLLSGGEVVLVSSAE